VIRFHRSLPPVALLALIVTVGCGSTKQMTSTSASASVPASPSAGGNTTSPSTPSTTTPAPGTGTSATPPAPVTPPAPFPGVPKSSHVFLLIEENQSFSTVYNNQMPYLSSLARMYAYAANYTSTTAGSMLDYLMLSSGSDETQNGCGGWGCPNQLSHPLTDDNIFREVTKAGLTWKVYAESLPQAGYLLDGPYPYVNRHNAAVWYSDIVNSTEMQQNIVPFTELAKDIANNTLPNYAIIIPNVLHDAHDGSPKQADDWLASSVKPLLSSPVFGPGGDALMLITFDECGSATNSGCGAHILTTVIGPKVRQKFVSNVAYNHLDALHTIMDALGIPVYPGGSGKAKSMVDFF
jgi:hypothetical protein